MLDYFLVRPHLSYSLTEPSISSLLTLLRLVVLEEEQAEFVAMELWVKENKAEYDKDVADAVAAREVNMPG